MNHEDLKHFGIYLLQQENQRKNANTGVESLTIDQIADRHAESYLAPVEITHTVTAEDFVNNPDLAEVADVDGGALKVGDEIKIAPISEEQLNKILNAPSFSPLPDMFQSPEQA